MRVTLKQDADLSQVKAKPRVYPPEKSAWLKEHFELLFETGMVYPNPQAICASVAMAFPKGPGKGHRLVAEFSAINGQGEFVPGPIRKPEIEGEKCVGAVAFCTMDCLQVTGSINRYGCQSVLWSVKQRSRIFCVPVPA